MKTISRKRWILINILLACIISIVGLFVAFQKESKKNVVSASAATSTEESLIYFQAGAAAGIGSTDLNRIAYKLWVRQDVFTDEYKYLLIHFADADKYGKSSAIYTSGARLSYGHDIRSEDESFDSSTINVYPVLADEKERALVGSGANMDYDSNGWLCIRIGVKNVPYTQNVTLRARVATETRGSYDYSEEAISDTRKISDVIIAANADPNHTYAEDDPFFGSTADFLQNTPAQEFQIQKDANISSENGWTFMVNVPLSMKLDTYSVTEEKQISYAYSHGDYTAYKYDTFNLITKRYLVITRAPTLVGYNDTTFYDTQLIAGGLQNYFFRAYEIPFDLSYHPKYVCFGGGTFASVSIDLPNHYDPSVEYYYYAQVIERVSSSREIALTETGEIASSAILHDNWGIYEKTTLIAKSDYYKVSLYDKALEILNSNASMEYYEADYLQKVAGIQPGQSEVEVTYTYQGLEENSKNFIEKSGTFLIDSTYALNKSAVISELYLVEPFDYISDFNVIYTGNYMIDGILYETAGRTYRQAIGYTYVYDADAEHGYLTIIYDDFYAKDLYLTITNNDPTNPLTLDYYTTDIVNNGGMIDVTFNFSDIKTYLANGPQWLVDIKQEDVSITSIGGNALPSVTDEEIVITVDDANEGDLGSLDIKVVADIVEDTIYDVTYTYVGLEYDEAAGTIVETTLTSEVFQESLKTLIQTYNFTNFMTWHGDEINSALEVDVLSGNYYVPSGIQLNWSDPEIEKACEIIVTYNYNTLIKVHDNFGLVEFYEAHDSSRVYSGTELVNTYRYPGWRVGSFICDSAQGDAVVDFTDNIQAANITLNVNLNQKYIVSLYVEFTDDWHFVINYMQTYKDTCFAVKKKFTTDLKVSDYPDIYKLTKDDIQSIMGVSSLKVCDMVDADPTINVIFDGSSTYTATLTYGHASLMQIDYNGNANELKIPLTSFADWTSQYGEEWSILFLNQPKKTYFKYSNDVDRNNLYGFFSVAVFKEQVSDLDYWFKNNTGDGQMTIFSQKQVEGSKVYKFFDRVCDKGIIGSILGHTGMMLCDWLDDDNAMYYSHFFYLDGSSPNPYITNGGADDAFDRDDAMENWGEDVGDKVGDVMSGVGGALGDAVDGVVDTVKNVWSKLTNNPFFTILKIGFGITLVVLIAYVIIWLGKKMGIISSNNSKKKK